MTYSNRQQKQAPLLEGHWKNEEFPDLPMPVPNSLAPDKVDRVIRLLKAAQKEARATSWRGFSTCRLCGVNNGSGSYELGGWTWPSGFGHYIEDHGVAPTDAFLDFIANLESTRLKVT
jgi:hypothetical protein